MLLCWAMTIPARFSSRIACVILAFLMAVASPGASSLEAHAKAYQQKRTAANRAALAQYAAAHPGDQEGAVASFSLAVADLEEQRPAESLERLTKIGTRLPRLADYVAYYSAAARFDQRDFAGALRDLASLVAGGAGSPVAPDGALLAAKAYKEEGKPGEAVRVLRTYYTALPQPTGDLLLAQSYRASNDLASACIYFQRVYYQYPAASEAEQAASALADLKRMLNELYPPPMTQAMFQRADNWVRARDFRRAREEYQSIAAQTAGPDRELARVRLAAVDYFRYEPAAAYANLKSLEVSSAEADSERLYFMVECARRLDRDDPLQESLGRLSRAYPRSPWRLKALITAANHYLIDNQPARYEPLYRACYEFFPSEPQAANCHWKVVWRHYIERRPTASDMLKEQVQQYPGSEQTSDALYFLGRLAEAAGRRADARAFYAEELVRYPNYYYAELAAKRLADPALASAVASPTVREFLGNVAWPVRRAPESFEVTAASRARIERARLLETAGLDALAERELRFGVAAGEQAHLLGMHLAQATVAEAPHRAIRLMKSFAPGYLAWPVDSAPGAFWRLLYPLPYRSLLETYSKQQGLDPFLVAGLIRQESEFNAGAVSVAKAYGLTQIMPATGRSLLKVSRRRFRPAVLFRPEVNLRLGTTHLRQVYDQSSERWELALAAYNAGSSRVVNWVTWGDYREPAEFIETIPFSETRNYVFAVLRNALMYRRLYGSGVVPDAPRQAAAPAPAPAKKTEAVQRPPVAPKKKHRTSR